MSKSSAITANQIWLLFSMGSLCILSAAYSFMYPALNWPDEAYKVAQLEFSDNLYFVIVRFLSFKTCLVEWTQDYRVGFGSNQFQFSLSSGAACYTKLKLAHLVLGLTLLFSINCFLAHDSRWLFMLSLLLPMNIFLLTGINNQLVFHLVATLCGVLLIKGVRPLVLLALVLPLLPVDRTFVTLIGFLLIIAALNVSRRWSIVGFVAIIIVFQIGIIPFSQITSVLIGIEDLSTVQNSLSRFDDGIVFSLAFFFISLICLAGTSTIYGFGPEYLLALFFIGSRYLKVSDRSSFHVYLLGFLAIYTLILEFTPTIQGYRYYVFVTPILIHYLVPKLRNQQVMAMCFIALSLGYLLQGIVIGNLT